jgi:glutamate synthase (NADPH/NADH) small chain
MPGVFASGDVVTGAKTVVAAVAISKQIAEDMDRYMKSQVNA